jgi:membrane protease YdiL (CAAX protease family)
LLIRAFGLTIALIASAALFGALHLANPNATIFAAAAIAVEAGLMLAAFYVATGRLWMSVGVHAAWNFMQGPFFGARVSGNIEHGSVFTSAPVQGASDILTGGAFGPEASLSAIIGGTAIFVFVMASVVRRGRA